MRFQALGDTIITLPYLQSLKLQYPETKIHFYTRKEVSQIPESITLFEKVIVIGGGRNARIQFLLAILKMPELWWNNYDAVLDLQNHKISRAIRYLLFPKAYSEFDKYSSYSAGARTQMTIEALGFKNININPSFIFKKNLLVGLLLKENCLYGSKDLVVINPAGNFPSRNWPLENYINWAKIWLSNRPNTQFVLMLLNQHQKKAINIKSSLGNSCINLSGKTTPVEAFQIIRKSIFVLSEDSGLMHMSWVQAIPTLALFGSSRKDWSAPQGELSFCLDSSDMDCGPCMLPECLFKDNRCLTRYSPAYVFEKCSKILARASR